MLCAFRKKGEESNPLNYFDRLSMCVYIYIFDTYSKKIVLLLFCITMM